MAKACWSARFPALFLLVVAGCASTTVRAQQSANAAPGPIPALLQSAKGVFISNAGMDAVSAASFRKIGMPNQPYDAFYAAMAAWGRYPLVSTPEDADLIFQIRFEAPLTGTGKVDFYSPQYELTILDAKSHFILWTFDEPVDGAFRKSTAIKNVAKGIAALIEDLKSASAQPAHP